MGNRNQERAGNRSCQNIRLQWGARCNACTTGNPFWGTKLLEVSIGGFWGSEPVI